ncbi:hypothetical protein HMI56_007480, partial [Coelomomyces lativittatus]
IISVCVVLGHLRLLLVVILASLQLLYHHTLFFFLWITLVYLFPTCDDNTSTTTTTTTLVSVPYHPHYTSHVTPPTLSFLIGLFPSFFGWEKETEETVTGSPSSL